MGMHICTTTVRGRMVAQLAAVFAFGSSNPCQSHRRRRRHVSLTGVRTADQKVCRQLHYHSATASHGE